MPTAVPMIPDSARGVSKHRSRPKRAVRPSVMRKMVTGGFVGLLSGASPLKRGLRQLGIGYGAAVATYLLGLAFNTGTA